MQEVLSNTCLNLIRSPKAIAGFVKHFWVLEGNVTKEKPFVHRALAESCPEFLFYYKGSFKRIINDNEQKCFSLEEKVMLASGNSERAQLVSEFLINRLVNVRREYSNILNTIRNTVNQNHCYSIEKLANDCNFSRRQFERKFREFSGFSPRVFLNIARFGNIIKNSINTTKALTEIAYENGYYDQSHFIRDFRKFSGYPPKEYFKFTQYTAYRATAEFQV